MQRNRCNANGNSKSQMSTQTMTEDDKMKKPFLTPDDTLTTVDDSLMKKVHVEILLDSEDDGAESGNDSNDGASHSDRLDCGTAHEAEATFEIDPTLDDISSSSSSRETSSPILPSDKSDRNLPFLPQSPPLSPNKKQLSSSFSNSLNSLQSTGIPNKNNIASPEFVDYIRSTEKELDALLSELDTIISPKNNNDFADNHESEDIDSDSINGCMTGFQKELSFGDGMDHGIITTKCVDSTSCRRRPVTKHLPKQTNVQSHVHKRKDSRKKELKQQQLTKSNKHQSDVGREMHFLIRAFVLSCFITATLSILLGSIYPASPLLEGRSNILQRFQLGLAAFSFGIATSIRTSIAAPLLRLDDRLKSRGIDVPAITQILNVYNALADIMEQCSHDVWEDTAKHTSVLKSDSSLKSFFQQPPEIDLGMRVPCDVENVKVHLFQHDKDSNRHNNNACTLRDVVTLELLMEYASRHFGADFNLASHPLILRNLWPNESFDPNKNGRRLTPSGILNDPQLSNFILPNYFSDATKTGYSSLVPDSEAISLSQFLNNILEAEATPYAKIGTQSIIEEFPSLREEIIPPAIAKELFGWDPWLDKLREKALEYVTPPLKRLVQMFPPTTYYPIFIAGMAKSNADIHSRTDLHTEPIGNIAVQLHGNREWILVPAKWSGLLRPTVSKHGRGKNKYSS